MKSILLDVDGVVADFVDGIERVTGHTFTSEQLKSWDVLDHLDEEEKEKAHEALSGPEFWEKLALIPGAHDGVRYLDRKGYEIVWLTSPWASCESWESARRNWLTKFFGKLDHYIPTSSKEKVVGDVLIDDKPDNVKKWLAAHPGKKAFIFDAPHNQDFHGAPRFSWEKVTDLL